MSGKLAWVGMAFLWASAANAAEYRFPKKMVHLSTPAGPRTELRMDYLDVASLTPVFECSGELQTSATWNAPPVKLYLGSEAYVIDGAVSADFPSLADCLVGLSRAHTIFFEVAHVEFGYRLLIYFHGDAFHINPSDGSRSTGWVMERH